MIKYATYRRICTHTRNPSLVYRTFLVNFYVNANQPSLLECSQTKKCSPKTSFLGGAHIRVLPLTLASVYSRFKRTIMYDNWSVIIFVVNIIDSELEMTLTAVRTWCNKCSVKDNYRHLYTLSKSYRNDLTIFRVEPYPVQIRSACYTLHAILIIISIRWVEYHTTGMWVESVKTCD